MISLSGTERDLFFGEETSGLEREDFDDADDFFWKVRVVLKGRSAVVVLCGSCRRSLRHAVQVAPVKGRNCCREGAR